MFGVYLVDSFDNHEILIKKFKDEKAARRFESNLECDFDEHTEIRSI